MSGGKIHENPLLAFDYYLYQACVLFANSVDYLKYFVAAFVEPKTQHSSYIYLRSVYYRARKKQGVLYPIFEHRRKLCSVVTGCVVVASLTDISNEVLGFAIFSFACSTRYAESEENERMHTGKSV